MKPDVRYRLLREGSLKLVETSEGRYLLYDLASDPKETRDLAAERPADVALLRADLEAARTRLGLPAISADPTAAGTAPELDEATKEQLKALGYTE